MRAKKYASNAWLLLSAIIRSCKQLKHLRYYLYLGLSSMDAPLQHAYPSHSQD